MSFFESYAFYFLLGFFIGAFVTFVVGVIFIASSMASRKEEKFE